MAEDFNYRVKDVIDDLFKNADALIAELSAKDGTFSAQKFLRGIAQRNQAVYIALLNRCLQNPNNPSPFNCAQQHIGHALYYTVERMGFERREMPGEMDQDLFGNPTKRVIYARKADE